MRIADYNLRDLDTIYGNPLLPVSLLPEDLVDDVRLHVTSEVDGFGYLLTKKVFRGAKREID